MEQYLKDILLNKTLIIDSKGIEIGKLCEINKNISYDDNIKLILSCDYTVTVPYGSVNNLNVLCYLNKITRLVIFNHSSMPLSDINNVNCIHRLTEFELSGFINQGIDLEPLSKYSLKLLDLELNATSGIYKLIDNNKGLKILKINSLDLAHINENKNLIEFGIKKSLLNAELLHEKLPSIETLQLNNIRKTNDFSFLAHLTYLSNISLRNTPIISFPILDVNKLARIELLRNTKLIDISSFFELESIDKIFISLCDKIPLTMLEKCITIKNLKQFYLLTTKQKTNTVISKMLREANIKQEANGFWD